MNFTFGIITTGDRTNRVANIIQTIYQQMMDEFEIIVVGGYGVEGDYIKYIEFNETTKPKWITKKKNLITENATYENIVYMHDYFYLLPNWYRGFREFGNDWDICMTKIFNIDGSRFRDWCVWYDRNLSNHPGHNRKQGAKSNIIDRVLVPYDYTNTNTMYISGGYWVAKKYVMEECPLNEEKIWGQGEDLEWSEKVLLDKQYRYKMNTHSAVKLLKQKDVCARNYPKD